MTCRCPRLLGLHPWFSHSISFSPPSSLPSKEAHYTSLFPTSSSSSASTNSSRDSPPLSISYLVPHLPPVISIETFLVQLEKDLSSYPNSFVGEIGLDKSFKLPHPTSLLETHPPTTTTSPPLSKNSQFQTPIQHQLKLVELQIDLAIKLQKNVSFHSVKSSSETLEFLNDCKKNKPGFSREVYVCLHSFGGSSETCKQIQKSKKETPLLSLSLVSLLPFES